MHRLLLLQLYCTCCSIHSGEVWSLAALHNFCVCVPWVSSVVQTHADTLLLMLNCRLAGKQTCSISAISAFPFFCMQITLTTISLISCRIQHTASCQIVCLLFFLHLNPRLSGFAFLFYPQIEILFFFLTSAAFTIFLFILLLQIIYVSSSLIKARSPTMMASPPLQHQTQHWESPTRLHPSVFPLTAWAWLIKTWQIIFECL